MEKRGSRNKTITLSEAEFHDYSRRLCHLSDVASHLPFPLDKTIHANLLDVLDALPDHFADLIIIDPPYNLTKQFGGTSFRASTDDAYRKYVREWLPRVCNKLKLTGSLYICCDWRSSVVIYDELVQCLHIMNRITWQRDKGRGALHNWKNSMEDIWFAVADPKCYTFHVESVMQRRRVLAPYREDGRPKDWEETPDGKFRNTYPSNFWDDISIPYWSMSENTEHPTQKPEKLIAKLILASSNEGDVVFDPFLGSGTTSVVAKKLGRHYIGVELDETFACLAQKRLHMADSDSIIQGYADGVFWERNTVLSRKPQ